MPHVTRLACCLVVFASCSVVACKPAPEYVRVKEQVTAPPDLAKLGPGNAANRAFQLRAFHLNHVWSDATRRNGSDDAYRAKVTVWDYANDESPVAELYFDDVGQERPAPNPDPAKATRPFRVHFPMTAFGPILSTLRNTNEPIFLYYYAGAWAVGTYVAEPVGAD